MHECQSLRGLIGGLGIIMARSVSISTALEVYSQQLEIGMPSRLQRDGQQPMPCLELCRGKVADDRLANLVVIDFHFIPLGRAGGAGQSRTAQLDHRGASFRAKLRCPNGRRLTERPARNRHGFQEPARPRGQSLDPRPEHCIESNPSS